MVLCVLAVQVHAAGAGPVDVDAEDLQWNRVTGWVEATGNVVIRRGDTTLHAHYVQMNAHTGEATAFGQVRLLRGAEEWTGDKLAYNFETGRGSFDAVVGESDPFFVKGDESTRREDGMLTLHRAHVTTCELTECPHYHVRAARLSIMPGLYMKGYHTRWHFGRVPVFYWPYWWRDLKEGLGFHLQPGYSSRMGAFLLTSYQFKPAERVRGETHLDYRTRRGFAGGQDFRWWSADGRWNGDIAGYYVDDKEAVDDDEDAETNDISSERYRLRLRQQVRATRRDYVRLDASYLSDTDILEDFFEKEYRNKSEPENFLSYTHRGVGYSFNAIARKRLNDFYNSVERLPELTLDIVRQPILGSPVYYQGETAAAQLRRVWADEQPLGDYDALRLDTEHTIYYPRKYFRFLTLVPRTGVRATWYSATKDKASGWNDPQDDDAALRSLVELGMEGSFKAFRVFDTAQPLRHVIEPYTDYTLQSRPEVQPDELYQFDAVDRINKEHEIEIGVRNKLQTKRGNRPYDLVDMDLFTVYEIERDDDREPIEEIYMDTELRLAKWVDINLFGQYNLPNETLDRFDTEVWLHGGKIFRLNIEHRYRRDDYSLVTSGLTLFPGASWQTGAYGRYEFEDDRWEEHGGYIQRNLDCMSIRTGFNMLPGYTRTDGSEREDEWKAVVELWLTAFPKFRLGKGEWE